MFIPRVKIEEIYGKIKIKSSLKIFFADKMAKRAGTSIFEFIPYLRFNETEKCAIADITLTTVPGASEKSEYYEISSIGARVSIVAKDFRGHINALATLSQMLYYENGAFYLTEGKIIDFPDKPFRSFMIDTGRKYIPQEEFKAQILFMARAKLNKLHIHLSDAEGYSIDFDSYKKLPSPDRKNGKKYTKDEIRELVAYAAKFGIDVIPEIDMPAHSFGLTIAYPELLCKTKGEPNGWVSCISNDAFYEYAKTILSEIAELFPYEYIHVGTDEIDMRDVFNGRFQKHQFLDWNECEVCRLNFKKLGLKSVTERFYYFLRKIYGIVTSLGKKMIIWNDNVDISKSPDIPRDILIEFWRIAAPKRGPRENCSMRRFLEEGFEVVNAHFPYAYIGDHTRNTLLNFDVNREYHDSPDNKKYEHAVLGGEGCAWDDRYYLKYSLYTFIAAIAERCYNCYTKTPDTRELELALTRFTLGITTPEGFNIQDYLKDFIPNEKAPETIFKKDADLKALSATLKALKKQLPPEVLQVRGYLSEISRHI